MNESDFLSVTSDPDPYVLGWDGIAEKRVIIFKGTWLKCQNDKMSDLAN